MERHLLLLVEPNHLLLAQPLLLPILAPVLQHLLQPVLPLLLELPVLQALELKTPFLRELIVRQIVLTPVLWEAEQIVQYPLAQQHQSIVAPPIQLLMEPSPPPILLNLKTQPYLVVSRSLI